MRTRCTTSTATTTTVGRRASSCSKSSVSASPTTGRLRPRRVRCCARWFRRGSVPAPAAYSMAVVPGASDTMRQRRGAERDRIAGVVAHLARSVGGARWHRDAATQWRQAPRWKTGCISPRRLMRPRCRRWRRNRRNPRPRRARFAASSVRSRQPARPAWRAAQPSSASSARRRRRAGMSFHTLAANAMATMAATRICCIIGRPYAHAATAR